jgi:ribonuclease HI
VSDTVDGDEPVSDEIATEWDIWKNTLKDTETLRIPRTYAPYLSKTLRKELHVFSDASEKAIAAVVYLQTTDTSGTKHIGFVLGKSKLAPPREHSIPRLELCAAVLAVEVAQFALVQLDLEIDNVKFYTDSKVVLGYISNETRRFFVYVGNIVERIRRFSTPKQWNYVPADCNPADSATRTLQAHEMHSIKWLLGPTRSLYCENEETNKELYRLIEQDGDQELRPAVKSAKTDTVSEPEM